MTPILEFRRVSMSYGAAPVIADASFAVGEREAACVVGPNGGGKTTLVKLALGLLTPQAGEIRVFGLPPRHVRRRIGYMPQHVLYDPQFPVTVQDIVLMGRLGRSGRGLAGWPGRDDRRAARQALEDVGMAGYLKRPFAALSGGERQRVLIARAICNRPELLLMDEPTSNVDSLVEAQMFELLRALNRDMAIVMVTHDLGFVSDLVEKVICVNRRVVVHPTREITGEMIHDIYGGHVRMVRHDEQAAGEGHRHD